MDEREGRSELADLAVERSGLITSAQARGRGVTNAQLSRMVASGRLERLRHGVYALAGVPHDDLRELRAAWLSLDPSSTASDRLAAGGPPAVVSHRAAAQVHGLGVLQGALEFTVQYRNRAETRSSASTAAVSKLGIGR